jgi:hypothetical protein
MWLVHSIVAGEVLSLRRYLLPARLIGSSIQVCLIQLPTLVIVVVYRSTVRICSGRHCRRRDHCCRSTANVH